MNYRLNSPQTFKLAFPLFRKTRDEDKRPELRQEKLRPENHLLHKKMAQKGQVLTFLLSLFRYDLMLAKNHQKTTKIPALHHTQQQHSHTQKQQIFIYIPFHPSPKNYHRHHAPQARPHVPSLPRDHELHP